MINTSRIALPALALCLSAGIPATILTAPTAASAQQPGWDEPPREMNEIQRRGYHDGVEGARRDVENHRQPNFNNRDEYRNANFPPEVRELYRQAFRRGYERGISQLLGGGGPPMQMQPQPPQQQQQRFWEPIPQRFSEYQRRGFQEGVDGAHKDFGNNRRPDPNNRDEYRSPNVPPPYVEEYREGFRRGYSEGVAQLEGQPQGGPWDFIPNQFSELERRGFHDGIDGARKDYENHRRPDPNNRDEYRDPHLPPQQADEYRDGFRRGYERALAHFMGQ
jgi:hypothetical protein